MDGQNPLVAHGMTSHRANRFAELIALTLIAVLSLGVAAYMVHIGRMGEAFGTLIGIVPLCLNRIGALGQSTVMNAMAEHLAKSQPSNQPEGEEK